jgi:hypothetical protein
MANESAQASVSTPAAGSAFGSRAFASSWWPAAAPLTPTPAVVTTPPTAEALAASTTTAAHAVTAASDAGEAAPGADANGTLTASPVAASTRPSGPWQRAAGVGVSVGQGAKRVGVATGGFVSRVVGKVWP